MNFRPTKWKILVSITSVIIFYLLLIWYQGTIMYLCYPCPSNFNANQCEDVFVLNLIPKSDCGCSCPKATPTSSIANDIIVILSPGILLYIIWSLFEDKKK